MIGRMRAHLAWGALALALSVAGCSGGDGGSESGSPSTLPAATATTTRGQSSAAATEGFCAGAGRADERLKQTEIAAGTAQVASDQYSAAAEAVRAMVDLSPDELREDARTIARAYDAWVEELRRSGWRPSRIPAETREKLLGSPDVRAAGDRVGAYQQRVCDTAG